MNISIVYAKQEDLQPYLEHEVFKPHKIRCVEISVVDSDPNNNINALKGDDIVIYLANRQVGYDQKFSILAKKLFPCCCVVISNQDAEYNVKTFLIHDSIRHVVASSHVKLNFQRLGQIISMRSVLDQPFDLKIFLTNIRCKIFKSTITDYDKKTAFVENICNFANYTAKRVGNADDLSRVVDELLINAMYRASQESSNNRPIDVVYCYYEPYFVVQIIDYYGTLTREKILEHFQHHMKEKEHLQKYLGYGTYLTLQKSDSLVYHIKKGVFSEVIFWARLFDAPDIKKNISFFAE